MIEAIAFSYLASCDVAIVVMRFALDLATQPLGVLAISLTVGTAIARRLP